ncbi:4825_t:CDS:2, partial [Funneliformis geosporum]
MTHPLLNSIFSETHKELQTLQQDFSCFQTHFVTIDSNLSKLNLEINDEILDEIEAENSDNLDDIEIELLGEKIKQNNKECFKKNIIETSCCQNNCLKDKIDTERAFLRNSNFESLSKSNQNSFLIGYLVGSSGSQHVTVKSNKRVKA